MRGKNKVLLNSVLYSINSLLIKAMGFLLLPVYTFFLTPKDYGITNLISGFTTVASFVVAFSLYSAVNRFYADYKNDLEQLKRFYGTIVTFVALSGSIFIILSLIFRNLFMQFVFKGLDFYPVVLIGIVGLLFSCTYTVYQFILQGMQNSIKYTITSIVYFMLNVILNLVFIGIFKWGATGVLFAGLIVNITFSIYVLIDLKKSNLVTFGIDKKLLVGALKYSLPILPHNLAVSVSNFISRILINSYYSLTTVGIYSVAMQFAIIADTIQSSVNMAFAPWFYETMNKNSPESRAEIIEISDLLIRLYGIFFLGITLFSQEVIILMTSEQYIMAWTVIPILIFSFSIKTLYYFFLDVLLYYKQASRYIFIATVTSNLINIFFCFILIPKLGIYGAALALVVTKVVTVVIVITISLRFDNIGYKIGKIIAFIMVNATFGAVGLYFSYTKYLTVFNMYNFLYKILIFMLYVFLVLFTFRKQIKQLFKSGAIKQFLKRKKNEIHSSDDLMDGDNEPILD